MDLLKWFRSRKPGVAIGGNDIRCGGCGKILHGTLVCIECKEKEMFVNLTEEQQARIKELTMSMLGIPYKYGAEVKLDSKISDIKQIDCSELIEYLYYQIGIKIPDGSRYQYKASDEFHGEVKVGDLLFKHSRKSGTVGHVGIYVGDNFVVDANGYYGSVLMRRMEEFERATKKNEFAGIRRLLKENIKYL